MFTIVVIIIIIIIIIICPLLLYVGFDCNRILKEECPGFVVILPGKETPYQTLASKTILLIRRFGIFGLGRIIYFMPALVVAVSLLF